MERIWLGVAVCSERLKRDSEPVFCGSDKQKVHPLQIIFLATRWSFESSLCSRSLPPLVRSPCQTLCPLVAPGIEG